MKQSFNEHALVAGVDVGGSKKGFHAVLLRNHLILDQIHSVNASELARWCANHHAVAVAVDSPCQWANNKGGRLAEHELLKSGIRCFLTPERSVAQTHPSNYYGWMLQGETLFAELEQHYPIFQGGILQNNLRFCFETFPHAIATLLLGKKLNAKNKRNDRLDLLHQFGIDIDQSAVMDLIDAAVCALMAQLFICHRFQTLGQPEDGLIIVPKQAAV